MTSKGKFDYKEFIYPKKRIGIVSFTDPRSEVKLIGKREKYIKQKHLELKDYLEKVGFAVIDPISKIEDVNDFWAVNNLKQAEEISDKFLIEKVDGLVFGCWAWNEPNIPLSIAKRVNVPIALITENNPSWPGITALTSTGASFWEFSNFNVKNHERIITQSKKDLSLLLPWVKAASTLNHLKTGTLILWGGSPALNMEHLNDDIPYLKNFIINDIITEDQYLLVERANKLLETSNNRIELFIEWLLTNGCTIEYDNNMTTKDSVKKQVALYIAAKDIINHHLESNSRVIGSSIKCQPELSIHYGVTACLIPAFLPFPQDHEGDKPIIPTVCEGDIKGLLTSVILHGFQPEIPPLFGDLKILTDNYFVIANCGGASAFYAAKSNDPKITLPKSHLKPQCQGETGGAFGYTTPEATDEVTYARLIRIDGEYLLQFGIGKMLSLKKKPGDSWGDNWPHTAIQLSIPKDLFVKALGTNHLSLTIGNFASELKYISKLLGISYLELDNELTVQDFIDQIK
ncbi:MAG: fucose isomerase [Asgard group archaeon]|nr:fucose isomerase [Asgard group archaeon]